MKLTLKYAIAAIILVLSFSAPESTHYEASRVRY